MSSSSEEETVSANRRQSPRQGRHKSSKRNKQDSDDSDASSKVKSPLRTKAAKKLFSVPVDLVDLTDDGSDSERSKKSRNKRGQAAKKAMRADESDDDEKQGGSRPSGRRQGKSSTQDHDSEDSDNGGKESKAPARRGTRASNRSPSESSDRDVKSKKAPVAAASTIKRKPGPKSRRPPVESDSESNISLVNNKQQKAEPDSPSVSKRKPGPRSKKRPRESETESDMGLRSSRARKAKSDASAIIAQRRDSSSSRGRSTRTKPSHRDSSSSRGRGSLSKPGTSGYKPPGKAKAQPSKRGRKAKPASKVVDVESDSGSDKVVSTSESDDETDAELDNLYYLPEQGVISEQELEFYKETISDVAQIKNDPIHCTVCDSKMNHSIELIRRHPFLKVLICKACLKFYGSGEFEKDDDGTDKYCRWCGQGGELFLCSDCTNGFCKGCIKRNLGKSEAKAIDEADDWTCYICDTKPIRKLRSICWAAQQLQSKESHNKLQENKKRLSQLVEEKKSPKARGRGRSRRSSDHSPSPKRRSAKSKDSGSEWEPEPHESRASKSQKLPDAKETIEANIQRAEKVGNKLIGYMSQLRVKYKALVSRGYDQKSEKIKKLDVTLVKVLRLTIEKLKAIEDGLDVPQDGEESVKAETDHNNKDDAVNVGPGDAIDSSAALKSLEEPVSDEVRPSQAGDVARVSDTEKNEAGGNAVTDKEQSDGTGMDSDLDKTLPDLEPGPMPDSKADGEDTTARKDRSNDVEMDSDGGGVAHTASVDQKEDKVGVGDDADEPMDVDEPSAPETAISSPKALAKEQDDVTTNSTMAAIPSQSKREESAQSGALDKDNSAKEVSREEAGGKSSEDSGKDCLETSETGNPPEESKAKMTDAPEETDSDVDGNIFELATQAVCNNDAGSGTSDRNVEKSPAEMSCDMNEPELHPSKDDECRDGHGCDGPAGCDITQEVQDGSNLSTKPENDSSTNKLDLKSDDKPDNKLVDNDKDHQSSGYSLRDHNNEARLALLAESSDDDYQTVSRRPGPKSKTRKKRVRKEGEDHSPRQPAAKRQRVKGHPKDRASDSSDSEIDVDQLLKKSERRREKNQGRSLPDPDSDEKLKSTAAVKVGKLDADIEDCLDNYGYIVEEDYPEVFESNGGAAESKSTVQKDDKDNRDSVDQNGIEQDIKRLSNLGNILGRHQNGYGANQLKSHSKPMPLSAKLRRAAKKKGGLADISSGEEQNGVPTSSDACQLDGQQNLAADNLGNNDNLASPDRNASLVPPA